MLDLKRILNKYSIQYFESGNTSRGQIAIKCCWCKSADPSHHLSISNANEYYCFRNPKHAGRNIVVLLKKLGIPASEFAGEKITVSKVDYKADTRDYSAWSYFESAENSPEMIKYLSQRLFLKPIDVIRKYGLKYAPVGPWSGRLLIPLTVGWLGRSTRPHIEPRYKNWSSEDGFFSVRNNGKTVIVVEGSLDGLKIAATTNQFDIIAKCRMTLSSAVLAHIREVGYHTIISAPDTSVTFVQAMSEIKLLRSYFPAVKIKRLKIAPFKDFGEATESEARRILLTV